MPESSSEVLTGNATGAVPRRRWFQFSLRMVLAAMAAASIWIAFLAAAMHRQKAAVAEVHRLGGFVAYDYEYDDQRDYALYECKLKTDGSPIPAWLLDWLGKDFFHDVVYVNMMSNPRAAGEFNTQDMDEIRHVLPRLPRLRMLVLSGVQATDECLAVVGTLADLEDLRCHGAFKSTDRGVQSLAPLRKLRGVNFNSAKQITFTSDDPVRDENGRIDYSQSTFSGYAATVTDESLRVFGQMDQLERLDVGYNDISDAGVEHLKGLTRLRGLSLFAGLGDLTDAGLTALVNMKELKFLGLEYCDVTPEGVAELQRRLPNLTRVDLDKSARNSRR